MVMIVILYTISKTGNQISLKENKFDNELYKLSDESFVLFTNNHFRTFECMNLYAQY